MTQGPWERHTSPNGTHIWSGDKHIADVDDHDDGHLIAAAPESYKGCIVARNIAGIFNIMMGDHYSDKDIVAALDALLDNPIWEQAIAKATGGE